MQIYGWVLLVLFRHPVKFCGQKDCDSRDMFLNFHMVSRKTCLKGYVNLWVEAPRGESPLYHVWWPLV